MLIVNPSKEAIGQPRMGFVLITFGLLACSTRFRYGKERWIKNPNPLFARKNKQEHICQRFDSNTVVAISYSDYHNQAYADYFKEKDKDIFDPEKGTFGI